MFGLMRNLYLHLQKKSAPRSFTIVFLGLDGSGKTTCVAALKGEPTEEATQTWGFSSEKVEVAQSSVEVYDLGGAKSIRRIWENYYAEVHGIVFVVDASDESRLPEAKAAFEEAVSHAYARGKPLLVCSNKQDLAKASSMTANDLRDYLDLDSLKCNHLCVDCSAAGKEGSTPDESFLEGMAWLVRTAGVQYASLQARVEEDVRVEKEKQEKKMEERRLRVEKLRQERLEQAKAEEAEESPAEQQSPPSPPRQEPGSPEAVYAVEEEPRRRDEGESQGQAQIPGAIGA